MKSALAITILLLSFFIAAVGITAQTLPLNADGQGMSALDAELYVVHLEYAHRADEIITRRQDPVAARDRELRGLLKARAENLAEIRAKHGK